MSTITDFDRRRMDTVIAGLTNKSEKMRRLDAEGFKRADIARYLGVRYQFVYNVLSAPGPRKKRSPGQCQKVSDRMTNETGAKAPNTCPQWVWTKIGKDGAVALPPDARAALGVEAGDDVQLAIEGDSVRILTRAAALREVQAQIRKYVPEGVSLVDELLAERRAEAAKEEGSGD